MFSILQFMLPTAVYDKLNQKSNAQCHLKWKCFCNLSYYLQARKQKPGIKAETNTFNKPEI